MTPKKVKIEITENQARALKALMWSLVDSSEDAYVRKVAIRILRQIPDHIKR